MKSGSGGVVEVHWQPIPHAHPHREAPTVSLTEALLFVVFVLLGLGLRRRINSRQQG